MHPEITAMAAAEHIRDMRADAANRARHSRQRAGTASRCRNTADDRKPRRPVREQTGWALVSLGLRIAASGGR
ncbi:MAG TPA: hypothetical protein VEM58_02220 [Streptosporangiaceae bacterium]|nr:hypothetical protein [Streptosporangiaceae bacterium]